MIGPKTKTVSIPVATNAPAPAAAAQVIAAPAKSALPTNEANIDAPPGQTKDRAYAGIALGGIADNAWTAIQFTKSTFADVPLHESLQELNERAKAVNKGDLSAVERLLSSQTVALNAIFNELAQRAAGSVASNNLPNMERYLRLALKAQSQCRTTAETIAVLKQGPAVFAKQANIAHGPQQVNNHGQPPDGTTMPAHAADEQPIAPNKLFGPAA